MEKKFSDKVEILEKQVARFAFRISVRKMRFREDLDRKVKIRTAPGL